MTTTNNKLELVSPVKALAEPPWTADQMVWGFQGDILKELGKGERVALSKLAVEHLERTGHPFRLAIDAAIWQFQNQAGQGGDNPALRTLYYRLLKLLALPIQPVFVYDGRSKPLTKRNKTVTSYGSSLANEASKKLIKLFRYPYHVAPGEAEAECALLQREGIVDAVMSQDVDALMWGSRVTLKDWSQEGTRGNKSATHVNVLRAKETQSRTGLDPDGMILVALLSGGDYDTEGLPGFGPALACEIAKAGFGADLLTLKREGDAKGMEEWRERLQYELETNESGYFAKKHKTLKVPDQFPDDQILGYYMYPAVSDVEDLPVLRSKFEDEWDLEIQVPQLRGYVAETFAWAYKGGAKKFVRTLAPPLLGNRLWRGLTATTLTSAECVKEQRLHFTGDGIPELRIEMVPADVVGLDLDCEVDNPAYVDDVAKGCDQEPLSDSEICAIGMEEAGPLPALPKSPYKVRKNPPWDPFQPERIWIPETVVKLGIPPLVEEWEEKQREILSDPKKFATRKCAKLKTKSSGMRPGAMGGFVVVSKPGSGKATEPDSSKQASRKPLQNRGNISAPIRPTTPTKNSDGSQRMGASPKVEKGFRRSPIIPRAGLHESVVDSVQVSPSSCPSASNRGKSDTQSSDDEVPASPTPRRRLRQKHARPTSSGSSDGNVRTNYRSSTEFSSLSQDTIAFLTSSPSLPTKSAISSFRAGASFQDSILISSSPIAQATVDFFLSQAPTAPPITALPPQGPPESPPSLAPLPSSVTPRTRTRSQTRRKRVNASQDIPRSTQRPSSLSLSRSTSHPIKHCLSMPNARSSTTRSQSENTQLPHPPSTQTKPVEAPSSVPIPLNPSITGSLSGTIKSHFSTKKAVISRESLPGTWKEVLVKEDDHDDNENRDRYDLTQTGRGVEPTATRRDQHPASRQKRRMPLPRVSCVDLADE